MNTQPSPFTRIEYDEDKPAFALNWLIFAPIDHCDVQNLFVKVYSIKIRSKSQTV